MKRRAKLVVVATFALVPVTVSASRAGDAIAGKAVFETRCRGCHAAPPYVGRVGEANLPRFLANPRRFNPNTAMTFPGLKSQKDIADVIAYITGQH